MLSVTIVKKLGIIQHTSFCAKVTATNSFFYQKTHQQQRALAGTIHQIPHHQDQKAEEISD